MTLVARALYAKVVGSLQLLKS